MKDIQYYLNLPYTVILRPDPEGGVVARVDELPGCVTGGTTAAEALESLDELKRAWVEDALEAGHPVPEPQPDEPLPSGKWVQRVPKSLHKKLVTAARRETVSLNTLVTAILSEALGGRLQAERGANVRSHFDAAYDDSSDWGWSRTACSIYTVHNDPRVGHSIGLAYALELLGQGLPKKRTKVSLKDIYAPKKSQRFESAC